jgi:hypothetical protein
MPRLTPSRNAICQWLARDGFEIRKAATAADARASQFNLRQGCIKPMIRAAACGDAPRKELIVKGRELERLLDSILRPKKTNW